MSLYIYIYIYIYTYIYIHVHIYMYRYIEMIARLAFEKEWHAFDFIYVCIRRHIDMACV